MNHNRDRHSDLKADCFNCFALCCVALPYAKSADFAFNKDGGMPCKNLQSDFRCKIHKDLRSNGFKGCTVYECFGAGQKVSQRTFQGKDWKNNPEFTKEMFEVFPIMQQLHEMLYYLNEALNLDEATPIYSEIENAMEETEKLTLLEAESILEISVSNHRAKINGILLKTSELVRSKISTNKSLKTVNRGSDLIGAKLRKANLIGSNLRGALLIAADLRESDLSLADLIGADLRDADLSGANLTGCIFLTQAQINSANGNIHTKLPPTIKMPAHWLF